MNQYERENVDRIINEIKEREKSGKMSNAKKAFYVYLKLGDIYQYKVNYMYQNHDDFYEDIYHKVQIYQEGTTEEGEAICLDMNRTFVETLQELGINAHIAIFNDKSPLSHVDACFEDEEGNWYFANLTADVMTIKTGMKTRCFGLSQRQLYRKFSRKKANEENIFYLYRMNEENDGKPFVGIPQVQLKEWADEFEYTYKGVYTNEVLEMLADEALDEKFISDFFGTNKKDELVQKKLEFVMKRLGIVNVHRRKKIGDVEALQYYGRIAKKIFSLEERKKIHLCKGFEEENGSRKARNVLVVEKETENVYYLYKTDSQIFEKIDKEELLKEPIKYYAQDGEEKEFSTVIHYLDERLEEEQR